MKILLASASLDEIRWARAIAHSAKRAAVAG